MMLAPFRHQLVGFEEHLLVGRQPSQQPIRAVFRINLMPFRERLGVLLQLRHAEQLRPQRQVVTEFAKQTIDTDTCLQSLQPESNLFAA